MTKRTKTPTILIAYTRRAQRAQKQAEADAVIAPVLESFKKLIAQQRIDRTQTQLERRNQ